MPSHLGSFILEHLKRLMNIVIREIGGFRNYIVYYTDTDSAYIQKIHCSKLVDSGCVGDGIGMGKNDYGDRGIFYTWFLAPKIKYCLVTDDHGFPPAKRTFKGFIEEHRVIKLNDFIMLSRGETVSGRGLIGWAKKFEGIKIPHRTQGCLECKIEKNCSDCVEKRKMNCFNCEMERACGMCLDLIGQKSLFCRNY